MTDQGSSVVVVPHAIVGDLMKAGITMSNRISTVGEVLAWRPTESWGEIFGGLAPAVVFKDGALVIIGLPDLAAKRLARVLRSELGNEDVAAIATDVAGFGEAMRAAGFEISASDTAVPLNLGESEGVLEPHWRDDVPEPVQDDLDRLLAVILRMGREKLEQDGALDPFCICLDPNDHVNVAHKSDGVANDDDLIKALFDVMRLEREEYRAFAIIQNTVDDRFRCLNVWLEHRDGPALMCVQPYKKPRFGGGYKFIDGDITSVIETHRVWVRESDGVAGDGE